MKKILFSFLFFAIGLYVVDRFGGKVMQWVNLNTKDVLGPKFKYIHDNICEDIVMIGSSRCHHHYVPSIISDTLNMSVYNCGIQGSENIYSHYLTLCLILERYSPKTICLELMVNDFEEQNNPFDKLSYFGPYFGYSDRADSLFKIGGWYWKYKTSHLYRYNAKAISNISGLFVSRQNQDDHGYLPTKNTSVSLGSLKKAESRTRKIDSLKMHYLKLFSEQCQLNNCKLIFTISPLFSIIDSSYYSVLKDFAYNENIPLLDYHTSRLYHNHPEYFRDMVHLNDSGARHFSSIFASNLKNLLKD